MSTLSSSQQSLIIGSCIAYGAVGIILTIALKCFYFVSREEAIVIERLGRFNRILTSGIHFVLPLIDAPRIIMWRSSALGNDGKMTDDNHNFFRIDLRESVFNFLPQEVLTNDGVLLDVNVVLRYKVSDVEKMVYETDDLMSALVNTAQGHIREVFSNLSCAVSLQNQKEICKMLESEFKPIFNEWGVQVTSILFSQLMPSEATRETLVSQITAEHRKRGSAIKAEGRKTAMRLQAEGAKITRLNMGLAEQEATRKVSEGDAAALVDLARAESSALHTLASTMRTDGASNIDYMISLRYRFEAPCVLSFSHRGFCRYMDTINAIAQSKSSGHQFVLPYESQSLRGLIKTLPKVYGRTKAGGSKAGRRLHSDA
jgi:regulator of protease activity HflC (stomatin/prohibitin superfamily)